MSTTGLRFGRCCLMRQMKNESVGLSHNVKDHYEDACLYLAHAIQIATGLGRRR